MQTWAMSFCFRHFSVSLNQFLRPIASFFNKAAFIFWSVWWLKIWKARKGKKTILCLYLEAVLQPTDTQASCHCRASLWPLKEKKECFKFQLKWVLNCTGASACGNLRITIFHRAWSYSCISVWPIESLGMFPWQREGTVCKLVLNSSRVWGSIFSIWNWQNIVQS